jgi:L-cysteine/cystine lyase
MLGCASTDVAVTSSTTDGILRVLSGLSLREGDEVLTSDEEHMGLLGPLQAFRDQRGVRVRVAPFGSILESVRPETKLVALSHVSWVGGRLAPRDLKTLRVPVLLDGAQGLGAVPVNVTALGCAFYASCAQKWLCGPDGIGVLYVSPDWRDQVAVSLPAFSAFADPERGLDASVHESARRFDAVAPASETLAYSLASIAMLAEEGWHRIFERANTLAEELAAALSIAGRTVSARGPTTIVSFSSVDAVEERVALLERGIVVRDIPGTPWLRASVGAWNNESDLEKLLGQVSRRHVRRSAPR